MTILKTATDGRLFTHLFGFLLLFNSFSLFATENELFFEMPIVLSANRLEQPVSNAAVSISIIDRETIIASGARTIPEVLRLVPGMQVGYSGNERGDEPQYVVTYHGHSDQYSRQMQVLIDGRSIYEPFFGGINWKSIPVNINDIERIEVSRGPNLATYGSNSFQAAINIITRTAAEDQGSFIQTNIGNNDIADLTYRYGGNNGKLDYRITATTLNDAGLDSANEFDYPDDTQSNNIDYRLDYQLDNKNTLSYQGGYGRNHQQTDEHHDFIFPNARTVENTHFFQFIKWENVIDQENTLLLQYYYNLSDKNSFTKSDTIDITNPLPPPATLDPITLEIDGDIKSERHNLELTHFTYPNESLKLVWGLSAQTDLVKAPFYLGKDDTVKHSQFRGFANIEWYINQNNIVNFGALAEKNNFTATELSPRLAFIHTINKQHSIRLGISQAIRTPFILEAEADTSYEGKVTINNSYPGGLFPETLFNQHWLGGIPGNSDLQNQKIISREIAYFGNFLNSALLFNARLFHDDICDFIDTQDESVRPLVPEDNVPDDPDKDLVNEILGNNPPNTVDVFQNRITSSTSGLELELDYHIDPTLRLIASGAILNISSNVGFISDSAPQHSFSFMTSKQFNEKYNGSLAYYYVDAFSWKDSTGTNEYSTLDMRLSRNIKFSQANASLSVVLKNLLGDYSDYQENPEAITAPKVVHSQLAYMDFRLSF